MTTIHQAIDATTGKSITTFGEGGVVTLDLGSSSFSSGSSDDHAFAVAIQADGKIVVAGSYFPSGGDETLLVARGRDAQLRPSRLEATNSWFQTCTLARSAKPPLVNALSRFSVDADWW